jgi:hypothetical protein
VDIKVKTAERLDLLHATIARAHEKLLGTHLQQPERRALRPVRHHIEPLVWRDHQLIVRCDHRPERLCPRGSGSHAVYNLL